MQESKHEDERDADDDDGSKFATRLDGVNRAIVPRTPAPKAVKPVGAVIQRLCDLPDDVLIRSLARVAFVQHRILRVVSRRINYLVSSEEFTKQRRLLGLVQYGLVAERQNPGRPRSMFALYTNNAWLSIASGMLRQNNSHGACSAVFRGEIWVIGGFNAHLASAAVWAYNPATNKWRNCKSLQRRRADACAGIVCGHLVVVGGYRTATQKELYDPASVRADGLLPVRSVERYDPSKGWVEICEVPHEILAFGGSTTCEVEGRLYFLGARNISDSGIKKIHVLQLTGDQFVWTAKCDFPERPSLTGSRRRVFYDRDTIAFYDPRGWIVVIYCVRYASTEYTQYSELTEHFCRVNPAGYVYNIENNTCTDLAWGVQIPLLLWWSVRRPRTGARVLIQGDKVFITDAVNTRTLNVYQAPDGQLQLLAEVWRDDIDGWPLNVPFPMIPIRHVALG